ncbi:MAG: TIM barrel protein [Verrucomicrobia bacterium]|nr:TIM barrel protein [Verrucomicrobiota bacterium]
MTNNYRFSIGPWNISEGRDSYGPETRPAKDLVWKLALFKKGGFDAVMFHDDDIVPDIDTKSAAQVLKEAAEVRKQVEGEGLFVEMVAPRLWFSERTIDGGYTSNNAQDRQYAIDRSLQTIDIAQTMGTELIVLWLAREGTYVRESKSYARSLEYLAEAANKMLAHHPNIRLAIEPKPNEPVDVAYLPTAGHVLAFAHMTNDPGRVGSVIESAHCVLAGLDTADELEFAIAQKKLWSVHLNDQNGLKFDQDKPFGSVNLRSAFDQVRVLERHRYGSEHNACVAFDSHAYRTSGIDQVLDHAVNSRKTFLRMLEKVRAFDESAASALVASRDYQALDQLVIEHLIG